MAFRDLDEFLAVEPLVLPIRGRDYAFPGEVSGRTWLKVQALGKQYEAAQRARSQGGSVDLEAEVVSDLDEEAFLRELCGPTLDEMLEDGVTSEELKLVLATLVAYHLSDLETAEAVWNARGEAVAPNRAERRSRAPAKSTRSRGSRAGSTPRQTPASRGGAS